MAQINIILMLHYERQADHIKPGSEKQIKVHIQSASGGVFYLTVEEEPLSAINNKPVPTIPHLLIITKRCRRNRSEDLTSIALVT